MPKKLLAPSGLIIRGISSHAFQSEDVLVDDDGTITGDGFGDFPHFTAWEYGGVNLVVDTDGTEFLASHCRTILVPEDFDDWLDQPLAPWPDDIIQTCSKAAWYAAGALMLEAGRSWLPPEMREDAAVAVVFDNILIGRARGMADSLSAQVAAWRLALETARKEAANVGWTVDIDFPKGPKRRLILRTPAGDRYKFISSSPRNVDAEISHTVRWVRQTIKEITNG